MITLQRHKKRIYFLNLQHGLTLADLITARLMLRQMVIDDDSSNDFILVIHLDHVYMPGFQFSQLRELQLATYGFSIPYRIMVVASKTVQMTIELIQEMYPELARHTYFCETVEAALTRADALAHLKPADTQG